ncbi:SDR family NAD(P)-dependent oxidoreductase [Sphingobium algorifonticola]|uniref:SDR family oxidoreductase n=1 Tax=Sphingobium algorifonticola TaxID=2008318 RepID=A0A437J715_9SPHN|nr:SDR family oxidoreductase [Sphingobium algorifonticola]RVT40940.1 SDR family oxidoreductase [Sphingobium algorifonticola]
MPPHALVTGASAGLGTLFCEALARQGKPLVIVARREERLAAVAADLRQRFGVTVVPIAMDLASADAPVTLFARLAEQDIIIDTLINNAGFGARGAFDAIDLSVQTEMVDLNCRGLMALCHLALPGMIARGDGAILNLASVAAFLPGPYMSTYYATKAFVLSLSQALHEEVKHKGVRVSALCPGPTETEFAAVAGLGNSKLFATNVANAADVVRDGMAALQANRAVAVSGLSNRIAVAALRFAPRGFARRTAMRLQKARG